MKKYLGMACRRCALDFRGNEWNIEYLAGLESRPSRRNRSLREHGVLIPEESVTTICSPGGRQIEGVAAGDLRARPTRESTSGRSPTTAVGARIARMPTPTARERILNALQDLPDDATFDDAIERLVFLAKIDAGLAELDAGKGIPHEEVKRRLGL